MSYVKEIQIKVVDHVSDFVDFCEENGQDKQVLITLYEAFAGKNLEKESDKPEEIEKNVCEVLLESGARKNNPCEKLCPIGQTTCNKHKPKLVISISECTDVPNNDLVEDVKRRTNVRKENFGEDSELTEEEKAFCDQVVEKLIIEKIIN